MLRIIAFSFQLWRIGNGWWEAVGRAVSLSRVKGIELLSHLLWRDRQSHQEHVWAALLAVWDSTLELLLQGMHGSLTGERPQGLEEESLMRSSEFLEWKREQAPSNEPISCLGKLGPATCNLGMGRLWLPERSRQGCHDLWASGPNRWLLTWRNSWTAPSSLCLSDFLSPRAGYPAFSSLERTQFLELLFMTIKVGYPLLNVTLRWTFASRENVIGMLLLNPVRNSESCVEVEEEDG